MAIVELYSDRQKKLRGEIPDIYQYEGIPLRVQIVHIIKDTFGESTSIFGGDYTALQLYKYINNTLCREYGVFTLNNRSY